MTCLKGVSITLTTAAIALALALPAAHATTTIAPPVKMTAATSSTQTYQRFVVQYRDGSSERNDKQSVLQNVQAAVARSGLSTMARSADGKTQPAVSMSYLRKLGVGADVVKASRKLTQDQANALMRAIAADPAVLHVQPDFMMHAVRDIKMAPSAMIETKTPNDPYYAQYQWDFSNPVGGANINNAWDLSDGRSITIASLDTGITTHPDLSAGITEGYDFISDASVSGRPSDERVAGAADLGDWTTGAAYAECRSLGDPGENSSWHGTHVAGTATELTNNGIGAAGVAYKAKLLPVRVLGHCGGYDSDIADAIEWASGGHVDGVPDNPNPAQVISMSLGAPNTPCDVNGIEAMAIQHAIARGTSVVVAAGNDQQDVSTDTPASCPGVIAVGSNGVTGRRAFYSNYGAGVTIAAPGGGAYLDDDPSKPIDNAQGFITSTLNDGTTTPGNPSYDGYVGTSQATPHVAGTVALMLSATKAAGLPTPTPAQIKDILISTARPFPVALDHPLGSGILDAAAAVKKAVGQDPGGNEEQAIALTRGVLLNDQSVNYNGTRLYAIDVPAGAYVLNLRSLAGRGEAALYVKAGSAPAVDGSNADFTSDKPGTSQAVVITAPKTATYYIRVSAKKPDGQVYNYTGVSVLANYQL